MEQLEFENRIATLKEKAKALNAEITIEQLIDKDHLLCTWYGGLVGKIKFTDGQYKGYSLLIGAYGDIRMGGEVNGQEVNVKDKQNLGRVYDEIGSFVTDEDLTWAMETGNLAFEDNNWFEVDLEKPNGEYVDLCGADNVLCDDLLGCFEDIETYYSYLDWAINS